MAGCCANCQNVVFDSEAKEYECHGYVPERGDDGWGAWPRVKLSWSCRQWLARLTAGITDKDAHGGVVHPVPDGYPSR